MQLSYFIGVVNKTIILKNNNCLNNYDLILNRQI